MKAIIALLLLFSLPGPLFAQKDKTSELYQTIKARDSLLFDVGFNTCDLSQFENLVSEDFEFYHDEAGITSSKPEFIKSIKEGICNLPYKPRRALDKKSLAVYPLEKNGVLYGAVEEGIHRFYAREKDKAEYLTSTAKFTHVWILENGEWKLSRGLSYNHRQPKKDIQKGKYSKKELVQSDFHTRASDVIDNLFISLNAKDWNSVKNFYSSTARVYENGKLIKLQPVDYFKSLFEKEEIYYIYISDQHKTKKGIEVLAYTRKGARSAEYPYCFVFQFLNNKITEQVSFQCYRRK
jgi:hypothetical protein